MVKDVRAPRRLDSIGVAFDDPRSVSDGGLLLAATLCERLGLGELDLQIVYRLRVAEPLTTTKQIAARLGIGYSTARKRLTAAVEHLRSALTPDDASPALVASYKLLNAYLLYARTGRRAPGAHENHERLSSLDGAPRTSSLPGAQKAKPKVCNLRSD